MLVAFWRTLVKIVVVFQHKRQRNKSFSRFLDNLKTPTRTVHALHHREHTILLSTERVNKGTKIMNSLTLSPLVISSILRDFTGKAASYKSCVPRENTIALNSYLGLSALSELLCGRGRGARARAGWRVWALGNGTIMLRKVNWDKTLQNSLKFSDCRKSIRKQIRPSCRKIFWPHFVLVWFRESNEIERFEWIFAVRSKCFGKELPPLPNFIQIKKIFAERGKT